MEVVTRQNGERRNAENFGDPVYQVGVMNGDEFVPEAEGRLYWEESVADAECEKINTPAPAEPAAEPPTVAAEPVVDPGATGTPIGGDPAPEPAPEPAAEPPAEPPAELTPDPAAAEPPAEPAVEPTPDPTTP